MSPEIIRDERLPEPEVLKLIREVAYDQKSKDEVTVLPLMCGTGKSTSISYLIKDAIEKNEGLVVMTDRIARFDGYLKPRDPELKEYLQQHIEQITVMTKDKMKDAYRTVKHRPVLLVTTQHYFNLERESIIKQLLTWEHGKRSHIIIDEKPELYSEVKIDMYSFGIIEGALANILTQKKMDPIKTIQFLMKISQLKESFMMELTLYPAAFPDRMNFSFFMKTGEKLDADYSLTPEEITYTDDDNIEKTLTFSQKSSHMLDAIENLLVDNLADADESEKDALKLFRAYRYMGREGALYSYCNKSSGWKQNGFTVLMNNRNKLEGLGTKVVILDGTADISFDYRQEYLHMIDCSKYRRKIPNLHIHIVNAKTSKTTLRDSIPSIQYNAIKYYVTKNEKREDCIYITFKEFEDWFKNEDTVTFSEYILDHLGNLRGKNDYIENTLFAQIGILLCPLSHYQSRMIDQSSKVTYLEFESASAEHLTEPVDYVDSINCDPNYIEYLQSDVLADIEQNVFRAPIRNSENTDSVSFYLFFDIERNKKLVELIKQRFVDIYGATVDIDEEANDIKVAKIMGRKTKNSTDSWAIKILNYINSQESGSKFTTNDLLTALRMTANNWKNAKRNPALVKRLDELKDGPNGHYRKP